MSSQGVRGPRPSIRPSIRTRLLVALVGLTTVSVLTVGYLAVNSVQSLGRSAQEISTEALRTQAQEYLWRVTGGDAQRNDLGFKRVQHDAAILAGYAASVFERPEAFIGQAFWRPEDHMFVGPNGQYMNGTEDVTSVFVPNFVAIDQEVLRDLELGAYVDLVLASALENVPNAVAVYMGTEHETTRYYPNINLGAVVPPDFQVTRRPWYVSAAPENNPERRVVWSPVYVDATGKGLMVTAAAPIYASGDEFVGVVGIDITLQNITADVEAARLLVSGYSFLVDSTGQAIALPAQGYRDILGRARTPEEFGPDLTKATPAFAPILAKMMAGATGFDIVEVGGRELFVAYAPLESTGWGLANVVEAEAVLRAMARLQREVTTSTRSLLVTQFLPVAGAILGLVVVSGLLLGRRLTSPIESIARAAQQIGAGQWDAPIPPPGRDEVGVLADAFAKMTAQLRALMESLEQRVAQRTQDLARRTTELEAAAEVAREAAAIRDVRTLLDETVRLISDRFGFYHAGIFLLDEAGEYAVLQAASSEGGQKMLSRGHRLAVGKVGIVGYVAGSGNPRIALDVGKDAVFFDNPDLPLTRSEMALPLKVRERVIGVLDVQSTEPVAFSEQDVAVLQTLADQVALAIENARLLEESQRSLRELQAAHGEYVRSAWEGVERSVAFAYDRVDVTPVLPQPHPVVQQALRAGEIVAVTEPEDGRAALAAPLRLRDQVIGAIALEERDEARAWTEEEIELVAAVSEQVALALENARLYAEAHRRATEQEGLTRIAALASSTLEIDELLERLMGEARSMLGAETCAVLLENRERGVLAGRYISIEGKAIDVPSEWYVPLDAPGFENSIFARGGVYYTNLGLDDPNIIPAYRPYMEALKVRNFCGVALRLRERSVGELYLINRPGGFGREQLYVIRAIAGYAANAIENARLFEETRLHTEELAVLNELGQALTARLNLQQVLDEAYRGASRLLDTTNFYIALYEEEQDEVVFALDVTEGELRRPYTRRRAGQGLTEYIIRNRRPLLIREHLAERLAQMGVELLGRTALSWLGVPLVIGEHVLGVMAVQSYTTPRAYDQHDLDLMTAIASQAAIALQNARLFEQTQAALAETDALYRASAELNTARTYDEILTALCAHTVLGQAQGEVTIGLFDRPWTAEERPEWVEAAAQRGASSAQTPLRYALQELPVFGLLQPDAPTVIADVEKDPRLDQQARTLLARRFEARSGLFVPLVVGGQWIGVIAGMYREAVQFPEEEVRRLMSLAGQAATAVQSLRLLDEVQRRATQLAAAAEVARDATAILNIDQLLDETVQLISQQFGFYHAGVFLLDDRGEYAVLRAASSEGGRRMLERGHRLKVGEVGIVGYVAGTGEPRVALDVGTDAVHFANPDLPDTRSEMALPLIARGRVIGVLDVQSVEEAAFSEEDVAVLRTMADQLATAIENAHLFSETGQALIETRELFEASRAIGSATTPAEVARVLLDYASRAGMDVARVLLTEFTGDEPSHIVMSDYWTSDGRPVHPSGTRLPVADFALSQFVGPTEATVVEDVYADPRVDEAARLVVEVLHLRSFVLIPLAVGQRLVGVFLVGRDAPSAYAEKLVRNLWTLCGQAAIAIENLRLLEETRHRARELEAINEMGRAITSVLDPTALIRQIVDITKARFGHDFVSVLLVEGDALVFEDGSTIGASDRRLERRGLIFDLARPGLVTDAVRAGQPVLVNDVLSDPRYITVPELSTTRSELVVPIEVKGRVIGALDVQSNRLHAYDQADVLLLQSLASQVGVAIENARLFAETEAEARWRALLNEVLQAASTSLDPRELLHQSGEAVSRNLALPSAIFLWEPESEGLRLVAAHTAQTQDWPVADEVWVNRRTNPAMFEAVEKRRTCTLESTTRLLGPLADMARQMQVQSAIYVPLVSRERVLGVLEVGRPKGHPPLDQEMVGFAEIIGTNLTVALENALLYQEAVQTAERLAEVDRLKSQFLANMSHELRTPLNSIIGFSRVILKGIDGPVTEMQKQDLEAIYSSGQHLLGLINDILDISKIEAGKMELAFEPTDLGEIIRGVMSTAIALVKDKPIELQQSVAADLPLVMGDSRRLRQVLLNLVSNAAKFTDQGFIRVEAYADEGFVTVSVSDSGIGIAADKLPRIFEAFSQVDASPSRKYGGTGLGLTISKSFVELHGGRIWAQSEPGAGSTFTFTIPIEGPPSLREQPSPESQEPLLAPEQAEPEAGRVVLCVDDDEGVITLFRRYLHRQGYLVVGLTDPRRVIQEAKRLRPYAITLDVMMPGTDGWEVIRALKADPEVRDIPVIMCTIVAEKGQGMSLGAADYLVKPILEQDLLAALDRLDREEGLHRVLVVDDQPEDRGLLRRMIESHPGYEVIEAASGQEAIALVRQGRPHIIVLDLLMPGVDGFAVLEAVKADEATRSIPIIVVTAKELTQEDHRLLNHRIEALIQKGVLKREELLEDVAIALRRLGRTPPVSPANA